MQLPSTKLPTHRLAGTVNYSKPATVDVQQWRELLCEEWDTDEIPETNTEEEWTAFCARAEAAMFKAKAATETVSRGCCRPKGSQPSLAKPGVFVSYKENEVTFQQRKLRRFIGRLHELHRCIQAGQVVDPALDAAVRRTWPSSVPRSLHLPQALQSAEEELALAKRQRRDQQLSKWRQDMNSLGRTATKWIHSDFGNTPASLVGPDDSGEIVTGQSLEENLKVLRKFWRSIWHRPGVCEELHRLRSGNLTCATGPPLGDLFLEPEELMKAARRKSGGAAGPCGFHGDELCHFPLAAWSQFAILLRRWAARQCYPKVWQHYRQVNLPKQSPVNGQLEVKHTRPISIQSAVCRTIATALAQKSEIKRWLKDFVTPHVHGGVPGRGVHTAALALASSFQQEHAVLLSLDMKKGYDFAEPELVIGHLRRRGLPEHWCQYFTHVWREQHRWIEWDHYVHPEPEHVSRSLPQGDPFAVLGFVLLLSEAAEQARSREVAGEDCALFVDDRTVIVRHPSLLRPAFNFWTSWSFRLGFEENLDKLAIVCASPGDEEAVLSHGFDAESVLQQTKVLGLDFQQRGFSEEGHAAAARRATALNMLKRIGAAPLSVTTKEVLVSSRALPKACWGVWLRQFADAFKFGTQIKYAVRAHRNGSRNLWELLAGPASDPEMYSLQQSFGCLADGARYWRRHGFFYDGGIWWAALKTSLARIGFHYVANRFEHEAVDHITWPPPDDDRCLAWRNRSRHLLREAFRRHRFSAFLAQDRRDSRELRDLVVYDEDVVARARALYRKSRHSCRAVLLGAAWSSMCYSRARGEADAQVCNWCGSANLATWHHLAWECQHFAQTRPARIPESVLTQRLGWPCRPLKSELNEEILEHLATVREAVRRADGFRD